MRMTQAREDVGGSLGYRPGGIGRDRQSQGFLTYDQVNEYLPDEAVNPDKLDSLLMALEDQGIELVNEAARSGQCRFPWRQRIRQRRR